MGGNDELADGGGIAQPEIESLRSDRGHDVRSLADQRDAPGTETPCSLGHQREHAASGLDLDPAQDRMRTPLDLRRHVGASQRA